MSCLYFSILLVLASCLCLTFYFSIMFAFMCCLTLHFTMLYIDHWPFLAISSCNFQGPVQTAILRERCCFFKLLFLGFKKDGAHKLATRNTAVGENGTIRIQNRNMVELKPLHSHEKQHSNTLYQLPTNYDLASNTTFAMPIKAPTNCTFNCAASMFFCLSPFMQQQVSWVVPIRPTFGCWFQFDNGQSVGSGFRFNRKPNQTNDCMVSLPRQWLQR